MAPSRVLPIKAHQYSGPAAKPACFRRVWASPLSLSTTRSLSTLRLTHSFDSAARQPANLVMMRCALTRRHRILYIVCIHYRTLSRVCHQISPVSHYYSLIHISAAPRPCFVSYIPFLSLSRIDRYVRSFSSSITLHYPPFRRCFCRRLCPGFFHAVDRST